MLNYKATFFEIHIYISRCFFDNSTKSLICIVNHRAQLIKSKIKNQGQSSSNTCTLSSKSPSHIDLINLHKRSSNSIIWSQYYQRSSTLRELFQLNAPSMYLQAFLVIVRYLATKASEVVFLYLHYLINIKAIVFIHY